MTTILLIIAIYVVLNALFLVAFVYPKNDFQRWANSPQGRAEPTGEADDLGGNVKNTSAHSGEQ